MAYVGENPNFKSLIIDDKAAAVVSNPPTGKTRLINRDGSLFLQDDTGTEREVGTGGGGTNFVLNPDAEINATNDTTATNVTLSLDTVTPLEGDQSFKITSQASAGTMDWDITIADAWTTEGGILLGISGLFRVDANAADGDWKVYIYNVTDAGIVGGTEIDLKGDILNIYRSTFVPITGKTYVLRLEFVEATTASWVVDADLLKVTPDSSTAIQAFEQQTNWVDESVVSVSNDQGGSIVAVRFRFSVDSNGQYGVEYFIDFTGATSAASHVFTLGLGGVTFPYNQPGSQSADPTGGVCQTLAGTATLGAFHSSNTPSPKASGFALLSGKPSYFDANLDDSKVNLITPNLLKSNIKVKYRLTDTAYTTSTAMDFDTEDSDYPAVGTWSNTNGVVTIPEDGYYNINAFAFSSGFSSNAQLILYKNGSPYDAIGHGPSAGIIALNGSTSVKLAKGDTISIRSNTAAVTLVASESFFDISRQADIGASEPVSFGTATETRYGLTLQNRIQKRSLTSPITAEVADVTELKFTNLVIGKFYTLRISAQYTQIAASTGSDCNVVLTYNGASTAQFLVARNDGSTQDRRTLSKVISFLCTNATVSVATTGGWNANIRIESGADATYIELEERNDLVATTDLA